MGHTTSLVGRSTVSHGGASVRLREGELRLWNLRTQLFCSSVVRYRKSGSRLPISSFDDLSNLDDFDSGSSKFEFDDLECSSCL